MWLLFIVLVAVVIFLIVRTSKLSGLAPPPAETPLDILKKRYAKGEITKEEYNRMKQELSG